jgi:hypothetical protein
LKFREKGSRLERWVEGYRKVLKVSEKCRRLERRVQVSEKGLRLERRIEV